MSACVDVPVNRGVIVGEWRVSSAPPEWEAEWAHVACCAEAHRLDPEQPAEPRSFDPDEWWPESCVA
jgi:hypothetical protein